MVFSSNIFLFLFLPAFLGLYYLTPFRHRSLVILIGSYAFYAWWRVDFLLLRFAPVVLERALKGRSLTSSIGANSNGNSAISMSPIRTIFYYAASLFPAIPELADHLKNSVIFRTVFKTKHPSVK